MPGARSLARSYKRTGRPSKDEKDLITAVLANTSHDLTKREMNALATVTGRNRDTVKRLVDEAREQLAERGMFYLDAHKTVVERALENISDENQGAKFAEVAMKASQWGVENVAIEGHRIVDKVTGAAAGSASGGIKIMIGVQTGDAKKPVVEGTVIDG